MKPYLYVSPLERMIAMWNTFKSTVGALHNAVSTTYEQLQSPGAPVNDNYSADVFGPVYSHGLHSGGV